MKKKIFYIIIIIISLIIPTNVLAKSTTSALVEIDVNKKGSLVITYDYNDYQFDDTDVSIYQVAEVSNNFQYQLSSNFLTYPIKINGIKNEFEWDILEETLDSYITADNISATYDEKIKDNKVNLTNLTPGLYYVKPSIIDTSDYILKFDNFLISIPDLKDDGTWNYDALVYPKEEEYIPKYETINYTVTKTWIDDGKTRPESIDIEIYEDGNLFSSLSLSSENNWTYTWTTDDDGSSWTVVERNIKEGYNVTIQSKNKNFYITNTDPNYKEENPSTRDNIKLYLYLFISSLIGIILLVISLFNKKKYS